MDGIHDLGGMDGMGPVAHEEDEPVFHEEWEGRVFAMHWTIKRNARAYGDTDFSGNFRYGWERMDPAYYLDSSYYEHWLVAMEKLLTEGGTLETNELTKRIETLGRAEKFDDGLPERYDPDAAEETRALAETGSANRDESVASTFDKGDEVVVKNIHPEGHTRCPRYVRRARGTVERVDGGLPFPDNETHGEMGVVEPVYHVRFDGAELWDGDAEENTTVYVDLWESYLEAP